MANFDTKIIVSDSIKAIHEEFKENKEEYFLWKWEHQKVLSHDPFRFIIVLKRIGYKEFIDKLNNPN